MWFLKLVDRVKMQQFTELFLDFYVLMNLKFPIQTSFCKKGIVSDFFHIKFSFIIKLFYQYDPSILPPTLLCRCRIAYFVKPEITKRIYFIRTEHPSKSKCANIMLSFTWKYSQLKALNILHCYSNKNWFSIGKIETWIPSQKISGQNDTPGWRLCGFISVIHLSTNMSI